MGAMAAVTSADARPARAWAVAWAAQRDGVGDGGGVRVGVGNGLSPPPPPTASRTATKSPATTKAAGQGLPWPEIVGGLGPSFLFSPSLALGAAASPGWSTSLTFSDDAIEGAFAAEQFERSISPFVAFCGTVLAASTMLGQGRPDLYSAAAVADLLVLAVLACRVWLHSFGDQTRAVLLFGRGWAAASVLLGIATTARSLVVEPTIPPVSRLVLLGVAALWALVPLYTRITAVHHQHRLVIVGATALTYMVAPPFSQVGQPVEAQLICAALLLGEGLGCTWERATRVVAANREPKPPTYSMVMAVG